MNTLSDNLKYNMVRFIPLVSVLFLLASCFSKPNNVPTGPKALPVSVVEIPSRDITGQTSYPVSIEGVVNNEVRAKIAGYITDVVVDEGQHVRKGQLLFRLETHSLSEDAQAAKANIEAAQVGVDQLKPLVEQNIVSEIQLKTAEAKLAQAKAAYKSITANIDYANITSPIDGYVGSIPFRKGNLVSPTSTTPLTTVSSTDKIYAYFSMNEAEYVNFLQKTPGKTLAEKIVHFPKVQLRLPNGELYNHEGKIQTVTAQVDPSTGTVRFRAIFPNPEHLIANGSSGIILIPKIYQNAVLVPKESTYEQQGKTYVYKLMNDSTVSNVVINIDEEVGNLLIIRSGVEAGEKIVARGVDKLHDKEPVIPVSMPFDSLANSIKTIFE